MLTLINVILFLEGVTKTTLMLGVIKLTLLLVFITRDQPNRYNQTNI